MFQSRTGADVYKLVSQYLFPKRCIQTMIKAVFEDMPKETGGGYARWEGDDLCIFIDRNAHPIKQKLTAIHEVMHAHLCGEVRHSRMEKISVQIADCLSQLGL